MIGVLVKNVTHCEYLDIKSCSCKKRLFGKLVLPCDDKILNTTEGTMKDLINATIIVDKKETCEKNNCLLHNKHLISLIFIRLLLLGVISVSCYYYCTKYWLKNECVLSC